MPHVPWKSWKVRQVRATRTLAPGSSLATESFTLTAPEVASITSWSDVRIRITDGPGNPLVYGLPLAFAPTGSVTLHLKTQLIAEEEEEIAPMLVDLMAFWELEEASGTRNDSHGANHLTDNNTVTSAAGKVGTCADFEKDNTEYLSIADNAALSAGDIDLTICAWVSLETIIANPLYIVSKRTDGGDDEYRLWAQGLLTEYFFRFSVWNGGSTTTIDNLTFAVVGAWYFVVAWHDATANTLNSQVNNSTIDSVACTTGIYAGPGEFRIGAQAAASPFSFDGLIDQVGIWKRVLTADERTYLYNGGAGRAYAELT